MRFVRLKLHRVRIPFRFSFKHSLAERAAAQSVLVEVTTDAGQTGWGECVPRDYLTGETVEGVAERIRLRWWPAVAGLSIADAAGVLRHLRPLYEAADRARETAAWAGLEIACLDAAARACGWPLRRLVAQAVEREPAAQPPRIEYVAPIGGGSLRSAVRSARMIRRLGCRTVKVKLGAGDDAARLRALRQALGQETALYADVNGAWTSVEEAAPVCERAHEVNVSAIEQPLPAGAEQQMAELQVASPVPLMADESVCTLGDLGRFIEIGAGKLVNLRLAKCGGVSGVLAQLARCGEAGLVPYLGALVGQTRILTAAAQELVAGFGARHPFVAIETSFPWLLLRGDPARGASRPGLNASVRLGAPEAGLGVRVVAKRLEAVTEERREIGA